MQCLGGIGMLLLLKSAGLQGLCCDLQAGKRCVPITYIVQMHVHTVINMSMLNTPPFCFRTLLHEHSGNSTMRIWAMESCCCSRADRQVQSQSRAPRQALKWFGATGKYG